MAHWVVRALASHQCGLGSIPARFHMWADFAVCSHLALSPCSEGFFSRFFGFPSSKQPTSPNSSSTSTDNLHQNQLTLVWLVWFISVFIYSNPLYFAMISTVYILLRHTICPSRTGARKPLQYRRLLKKVQTTDEEVKTNQDDDSDEDWKTNPLKSEQILHWNWDELKKKWICTFEIWTFTDDSTIFEPTEARVDCQNY